MDEKNFLVKLFDVLLKINLIGATRYYHFLNYLKPITEELPQFTRVSITGESKEQFLRDIDYRIKLLKITSKSIVDGLNLIKFLLRALYRSYLNDSDLLQTDFQEQDREILKYLVAKEILGDLFQYVQIDNKTVPLKYTLIATNFYLLKLKGLHDIEILKNMKKVYPNLNLNLKRIREFMEIIEKDGIVEKIKIQDSCIYKLKNHLELSEEGKRKYDQVLKYLIRWPTLFYREFFDIRELNVSVNETFKNSDQISQILKFSAIQGFQSASYVFENLAGYYENND